ncbi:neutral zinc metallopeptidase [Nocardia tengchongensis]|uniref:neutral zinc metallopeptidase n=1 Tax=Nocardia tengchongensis TaxID=2055889 RepID=UPI003679C175
MDTCPERCGRRDGDVADTAGSSRRSGAGGAVDKLALNAISDIADYWNVQYAKTFPGAFKPVTRFISWDSTAPRAQAVEFCRGSTYQEVNAAYCSADKTIGFDRGTLLPGLVQKFGPMSVVMVLAHEYGHSIQAQAELDGFFTPTVVREQQARKLAISGADSAGLRAACFSGAYSTKLSQPGSDLQLSATDLDAAISGLLMDGVAAADVNGAVVPSGFVRLEAFRTGVLDGEDACLKTYK